MSPTTRNTLMIGGGLIVAALLFTCGPLKNMFGGAETSPQVAAGPPADLPAETGTPDAMAGAVAGAAVGADVGASDLAGTNDPSDSLVAAGVAAGTAGASAAAASTRCTTPNRLVVNGTGTMGRRRYRPNGLGRWEAMIGPSRTAATVASSAVAVWAQRSSTRA